MPSPEISHRVEQRLGELCHRHRGAADGRPAQYYTPGRGLHAREAFKGEEDQFAISLATTDGELYHAGDHQLPFALQSVSKIFSYGLALEHLGREEVLRHVGVEPSGDAFNSIVFDERNNRPFNPMVNARALVTTHLVHGRSDRVRDVLSVMYTCGMYDFAGEWAFEIGVPAKSGVSGAILCVIPGKLGIAVFSPGLDRHGNSVRGIGVCKEISERLGLHVFATEAEDAMLGSAPAVPDAS